MSFSDQISAYSVRSIATLQELRALSVIDAESYEDCSISFEAFASWWSCYPLGNTVVWRQHQIVASLGLWPLSAEQYTAFTTGLMREETLRPLSLEQCAAEPSGYWYLSGIVVIPALRRKSASPLRTLIAATLNLWSNSGHVAAPVRCCALGYADQGRRLLGKLGFAQISSGAALPDRYPLYEGNYASPDAVTAPFHDLHLKAKREDQTFSS